MIASNKETWYEKFEILLKLGLPVNAKAGGGELLLPQVLTSEDVPPDVVTLLLEHGADLTIKPRNQEKTIWETVEPFASEPLKQAVNAFLAKQKSQA